jgi:hypothetical protein
MAIATLKKQPQMEMEALLAAVAAIPILKKVEEEKQQLK